MDNRREILKQIGHQLDEDIFPRIKNSGIVTPGDAAAPTSNWAEEINNERSGTTRSETGAWTGPPRGKRQADRHRAPSATPPIILADLQSRYESELSALHEAYPGTKVWSQTEGMWLLTEGTILPGQWQKAIFLTGIPFDRSRAVRSWGFWVGVPLRCPTWIGPRHTNFPDGSICAFEPRDGTWSAGDSLVVLLDLFALWALRHLHLQAFGRWPGRQTARWVHERLGEIIPSEYCGCGSAKFYEDCCLPNDLSSDRIAEAAIFQSETGGVRTPPGAIVRFIRGNGNIPEIVEMLPQAARAGL